MLQVTFAEVARVLEGLGSSVPAAEAHGCLVGALCSSPHYPMERWLEEIIPDEQRRNDDDSQQTLRLLYADTLKALRGEDMEFQVLLPDDDISLGTRAGGLSQWCQGFLYGFGTGGFGAAAASDEPAHEQAHEKAHEKAQAGAAQREQLPGNVNEILNDLTHIGRASVELEEGGDESEEEAYAEVVEYVRVGVQLIHDELIPAKAHRIDMGEFSEQGSLAGSDEDPNLDPDNGDPDSPSNTLH